MTNRSTRALFHSKTLNTALRAFSFPQDMEVRRQKLGTWIAALKTGTLDEVKEVSLHGNFINDIFQDVLGYCSVIQGAGKAWEINAEQTISDGGGSADGAILAKLLKCRFSPQRKQQLSFGKRIETRCCKKRASSIRRAVRVLF